MLSPEIIEQRRGKINASASHRMMAGWDAPKPSEPFMPELYDHLAELSKKPLVGQLKAIGFDVSGKEIDAAYKACQYDKPSTGLITYAEELACDELFEHDPMTDVSTKAMDAGNEREPDAVDAFFERTGIQLYKTGEDQIHLSANGFGATPDGIVYDDIDLIESGAEIKSRTPLHHARQLLINDNASLIEHDFDRYCQIQVACIVSGAAHWYSISYNPYAINDAHKLHYCVIKRDDKFIAILNKRAELVYEHKALFLKKLLAVKSPKLKVAA